MTEEDEFTTNIMDDRIYVDMRRSKGYADELEKINRDESRIALTISLKEAAGKKMRFRITKAKFGTYYLIGAI